jgi:hypothetical protein
MKRRAPIDKRWHVGFDENWKLIGLTAYSVNGESWRQVTLWDRIKHLFSHY